MKDMQNMKSMKKMKMTFFKLIEIIYCSIFAFFLLLLSGCAGKERPLFDANYKTKQAQFADSSINYVVCKDCVQYTRIQSFRNFQNY